MSPADFDYELPEQLIARYPVAKRTQSRLLIASQAGFVDAQFADIGQCLRPGDLLIANDTRVIPARLFGHKASGGAIEILLERIGENNEAIAQIRASKSPQAGGELTIARRDGGEPFNAQVISRDDRFFRLRFAQNLQQVLEAAGHVPLPPYIDRSDELLDQSRYQTVYAQHLGAVAAPTAGLHFDEDLLAALRTQGVAIDYVTLHVGAGTFQPLTEAQLESGTLHAERIHVSEALCAKIAATKAAGGRIVCVGTTTLRALESAAAASGQCEPFEGETNIFIRPGYRFRVADALITNFHLPKSSLMMLVSAFAGHDLIMRAYAHAVDAGYRFFSYGDAMALTLDSKVSAR